MSLVGVEQECSITDRVGAAPPARFSRVFAFLRIITTLFFDSFSVILWLRCSFENYVEKCWFYDILNSHMSDCSKPFNIVYQEAEHEEKI